VHRAHAPTPTYAELHHVIPRAWQAFWTPPVAPYAGTYAGQKLWDARTITICRTGHGNVHHWITALTHAWTAGDTIAAACSKLHHSIARTDFIVAVQALERWIAAGGSIDALVAAGLWGEI